MPRKGLSNTFPAFPVVTTCLMSWGPGYEVNKPSLVGRESVSTRESVAILT